MSNYTKSTNFATKDNLTPGDPLKIVRGTEIDTEFNNIATAIATKTDNASAAITGGTINDTTIGATTASTGAFTTLAASGNVTLSGGTANGVAYLNGSKVVTSGSALTFDGTTFQSSVSASGEIFKITGTGSGAYTTSVFQNTNAGGYVQQIFNVGASGASGQAGIQYAPTLFCSFGTLANDATTPITFKLNGTEQMRLTSTGLGIGTSSPSTKLTVSGGYISATDGTRTGYFGSDGTGILLGSTTNHYLRFITNDTERLRLDSSGNLGLGVTPSAWFSSYKTLQVSSNGSLTSNTDFFAFSNNAFVNSSGNDIYLTTGFAGRYRHVASNGAHQWSTAPSGTAGNAITFTQAMSLTANGELLVGTTSAIQGGRYSSSFDGQTVNGIVLQTTYASAGTTFVRFVNSSGTAQGEISANSTTTVLYSVTSDQRLKENIQNSDSASSLIDSLQVRKFDWKADGSHQRYGFVAQELVTVAPEAVHQPSDAEEMMAVDYSKLVPMLVKEIQSLRVRVAQLESN
jgi:hypothetical protein